MPEHLAEHVLEMYCLGSSSDTTAIEAHLRECESCRVRRRDLEAFVGAIRSTLRELEESPLDVTHQLSDGRMRLWVDQDSDGAWRAHIGGLGEARFDTLLKANEHLIDSLQKLYPQHECDEACTVAALRMGSTPT